MAKTSDVTSDVLTEDEIEMVDETERKLGEKSKRKDWDENLICDGILSNEDFQKIKQLKRNKEAMSGHGLKIPDSEQLRMKRVDPAEFQAHIKLKLTKEQRLELVKAGREDRGKYRAKTAIKHRDRGGLSNRQKEQKKSMPLAAKRSRIAKSKLANQRKQSKKNQFRGRKAWK